MKKRKKTPITVIDSGAMFTPSIEFSEGPLTAKTVPVGVPVLTIMVYAQYPKQKRNKKRRK